MLMPKIQDSTAFFSRVHSNLRLRIFLFDKLFIIAAAADFDPHLQASQQKTFFQLFVSSTN